MNNSYSSYEEKFLKKGYTLSKENNGYRIASKSLNIFGKAPNTLWTASSLLCNEEYFFSGPPKKYVVIDIGLNIGIASLYFALKSEVTHIYGYEPFKESFDQAVQNLDLNPKLKSKISIYNVGLGKEDVEKKIHYNDVLPGSMSTCFDRFVNTDKLETITLKNAADELMPIFKNHKEQIVLKMDCEGSEVDILPNLYDAGLLEKVKVIIMEWHFVKPDLYIKMLNELGFFVFNTHEQVNYQGIIRAFRI